MCGGTYHVQVDLKLIRNHLKRPTELFPFQAVLCAAWGVDGGTMLPINNSGKVAPVRDSRSLLYW